MSIDESKQVIRRYFDQYLNTGDANAADQVLAADFVCHTPDGNDLDREGYKRYMSSGSAALPDVRFTPLDVIAEDDRVAVRFTLSGTHRGTWQGIPPTGNRVTVVSICTYRVAGGKIAEKWLLSDSLGLLRQLGALPQPQVAAS